MSQQVNDRLETLESRLAYAEYTVEQLNEEVTTQGRELDRLKHQIQLLVDKLQSVQPSQIASMAEETPPPPYGVRRHKKTRTQRVFSSCQSADQC